MVVVAAAGIVRSWHMAAVLSLFHAPVFLLRTSNDLLLLLHLHRLLLRGFALLPVVLMRAPGVRGLPSGSMTMTRGRTNLGVVPVQLRAALDARCATQEFQSEGLPSSATFFLGPTAKIRWRLRVATGRRAVAFLEAIDNDIQVISNRVGVVFILEIDCLGYGCLLCVRDELA